MTRETNRPPISRLQDCNQPRTSFNSEYSPELVNLIICLLAGKQIRIREQQFEAAPLPGPVQYFLSLLGRIVEQIPRRVGIQKPGDVIVSRFLKEILDVILIFDRLIRVYWALIHGQAEVGRAHEASQVRGFLRRFLRNLDARGPRADDGDPFAFVINPFRRPERRMTHVSPEVLEARPVGEVAAGGETQAADEEARGNGRAVFALDVPFIRVGVEACGHNAVLEEYVFADTQDFVDVLEVALQFLLAREFFRPPPGFVHFRDRQGVDGVIAVDASTRV